MEISKAHVARASHPFLHIPAFGCYTTPATIIDLSAEHRLRPRTIHVMHSERGHHRIPR